MGFMAKGMLTVIVGTTGKALSGRLQAEFSKFSNGKQQGVEIRSIDRQV